MENKDRSLEWEEFVNSHIERCKKYEEESKLSSEEYKEILQLIRNDQANNEQIIRFAKYHIGVNVNEIPVDVNIKVIPVLNGNLQEDYINTLGIAIANRRLEDNDFVISDYGLSFFEKWGDVSEVFDLLDCDVLEQLARKGHQGAFDYLYNLGLTECMSDSSSDNYNLLEFIIECEDAGVDIKDWRNLTNEEVKNGNEEFIHDLASLGAFRYLDYEYLCTWEWVKEYLDGNDIVAEIAAKYIDQVIQSKNDIKWLEEEVDDKVPQAQYLMGILNLGVGGLLDKNNNLALGYFRASDSNGCGLAKEYILKIEEELVKEAEEEKQRKQVESEAAASAKILIQKAENGEFSSDELFELAAVLSYGDASKGIKKNLKKATKLYRMAAEQGSAKAQYQLGIHLVEGIGCHKNWNAGIKWLKKSAEQNYDPADTYLSQQNTFFNRLLHKFIK